MVRLYRLGLLCFALVAVLSATGSATEKAGPKAEVAAVTKVSDSAYAVFKKAITEKNSELLLSFFIDTSAVVMPDRNGINGLEEIRKRVPLLMRVVGGGKLELTRTAIRVNDEKTVARDAGYFTLTRELEDGGTWRFDGLHTLYWVKDENGNWMLSRVFVGENPRPKP